MGELLTLRQQRLPVKIVVFNNGSLGFVELEMKVAGLVPTGVSLDNPDFAAVARACGLHGVRVERPGELGRPRSRTCWRTTGRRCSTPSSPDWRSRCHPRSRWSR